MKIALVSFGLIIAAAAMPVSAAPIPVHSSGNGSLSDGAMDPYWTYTNSSGITAPALVAANPGVDFYDGGCHCNGPWTPNTVDRAWLVDNIANSLSGGNPLSFSTTFDMTGLALSTATLNIAWGVDDAGIMLLNGHQIASLPTQTTSNWGNAALNPVTVFGSSGYFLPGTNVLTIQLTENDNGFEGVIAELNGVADAISDVPEPSMPMLIGLAILALATARRKVLAVRLG